MTIYSPDSALCCTGKAATAVEADTMLTDIFLYLVTSKILTAGCQSGLRWHRCSSSELSWSCPDHHRWLTSAFEPAGCSVKKGGIGWQQSFCAHMRFWVQLCAAWLQLNYNGFKNIWEKWEKAWKKKVFGPYCVQSQLAVRGREQYLSSSQGQGLKWGI